jgi:two-component system, oxyanion-binding sensor
MSRSVRIGLLRLADAAPVIAAAEWGMFERHGLDATLSVEPSWANVADKLAYGLLDAAVILPPLAMAASLGLRGPRADLIVPMGLSRAGNTVVLSAHALRTVAARQEGDGIMARGRATAAWIREAAAAGTRPRLGIVHLFSGHNLLLRYWLAAGGAEPDRDVEFVVLPPSAMERALADGRIDGFCAGAPWGTVAERDGSGRVVARGSEIWHRHPEKVLGVRRAWADEDPGRLDALLRALGEAARLCDDPDRGDALAAMLAAPAHVDAPAEAIRSSLPQDPPVDSSFPADPISFSDAHLLRGSEIEWFSAQMCRWRWMSLDDRAAAHAVFRPGLAAAALGEGSPPSLDRFCDSTESGHTLP